MGLTKRTSRFVAACFAFGCAIALAAPACLAQERASDGRALPGFPIPAETYDSYVPTLPPKEPAQKPSIQFDEASEESEESAADLKRAIEAELARRDPDAALAPAEGEAGSATEAPDAAALPEEIEEIAATPAAAANNPLDDAALREARVEEERPPAIEVGTDTLIPGPIQSHLWKRWGQYLEAISDHDEARGAYARAVALGREDLATWRGLARTRVRDGNLAGAEGALLAALAHGTANTQVYRELGELYLLQGDLGAAVRALSRASELAPGDQRISGLLARARFQRDPEISPAPDQWWSAWPRREESGWRQTVETQLRALATALPLPLRDALKSLGDPLARPDGRRLGLATLALLATFGAFLHFGRGRGDIVVAIEYPTELRGVFSVRIAGQKGRYKRSSRSERGSVLKQGASTATEHHLVSRETQFRRQRAGSYWITVEGVLQDSGSEEILRECYEEQEVRIDRGATAHTSYDFAPQLCPVDVRICWDNQTVKEAAVAASGQPHTLRYARGGTTRLELALGDQVIVVGSGDRVAEMALAISSVKPVAIEIDLANAEGIVFKGCPPAVEPFVNGDLRGAARALEREGQESESHQLLARWMREQNNLEGAADHLERAGRPLEAAAMHAESGAVTRAAELFREGGEPLQAAKMFLQADELVRAGEAFSEARDLESAIQCFEQAGETSKWMEALERRGDAFEAAQLALRNDDRARAIRLLQIVPSDDSNFEVACEQLAEAFEHEGHTDMAAQKLEDYLDTTSPEAARSDLRERLGNLHAQTGQFERAIEVMEDLRRLEPTYPNVATRIEELRKQALEAEQEASTQLAQSGQTGGVAKPMADQTPTGFLGEERYELLGEIGRGGMGVVFKARDTRLNRIVALKRLPENLRDHPKAIQLFLREAQASARLTHPNITTVYDVDQAGGAYFITMELLQGQPINQILRKRGRFSPKDVARLGMQMASGLHYAHEQRIVHRDIKSANLFFTVDRTVKIMDFGLAKMLEEVRRAATVIGGTPFYMAPEQAIGENVDHRADIYAFGVTLFEWIVGRVPFKEGDVAYHHRHTAPPDPRSLNPDCPDLLAELILHMLEKPVEARCNSAAEVKARLAEMLKT